MMRVLEVLHVGSVESAGSPVAVLRVLGVLLFGLRLCE